MFPSPIRRRLWRCRLRPRRAFGCESHCFRMSWPMWESTLATYENRHSFKLPEDYRNFLKETGDGPAGPAYGLIPMAKAIDLATRDIADALAMPLPLTPSLGEENSELILATEKRSQEVPYEEMDAVLAELTVGSLPICHEGCNYHHLLVLNGPFAGTMWIDRTSADQGVVPLGIGFAEWYERWLRDVESGGKGTWWHEQPRS